MLEKIIAAFKKNGKSDDLIKLVFDQVTLDCPIILQPEMLADVDVGKILERISVVLQSKKNIKIDETFFIHVSVLRSVNGGANVVRSLVSEAPETLYAKRSLVRILNAEDYSCLPRAIIVSWASKLENQIANEALKAHQREDEDIIDTILRVGKASPATYKSIRDSRSRMQDKFLSKLLSKAGLENVQVLGLEHIEKIENVLKCCVYVVSQLCNDTFLRKPEVHTKQQGFLNVYVYHHRLDPTDVTSEMHYDAITRLAAFFGVKSICEECCKSKSSDAVDCCLPPKCSKCNSRNCHEPNATAREVFCPECTTTFYSQTCFENHLDRCHERWTCPKCLKIFKRNQRSIELHQCGEYYCHKCDAHFIDRHECYVRSKNNGKDLKKNRDKLLIFFDIETTQNSVNQCEQGTKLSESRCATCQDDIFSCNSCSRCINCGNVSCGTVIHEANLIVAQKVCLACMHLDFESDVPCNNCGDRCSIKCRMRGKRAGPREYKYNQVCQSNSCGLREKVFFGDNCMENFVKWLLQPEHDGSTLISHNGSGFDHYIFLNELIKWTELEPAKVLFAGTKLILIEINDPVSIRCIDSYKFMPFALSTLPKNFGLKTSGVGSLNDELCKGYFPHLFNCKENEDYIGPYPTVDQYGLDNMKPSDAESFLVWHTDKVASGQVFNFHEEIIAYCKNDVAILRMACLQFRKDVLEMTGVEPFDSITLPSLAMTVFQRNFLVEMFDVTLKHSDDDLESFNPNVYQACQKHGRWKIDLCDGQGMKNIDQLPVSAKIDQKQFTHSFIGRVPPGGYRKYIHGHSKSCLQWLEYLTEIHGVKIYHAGNWCEICIKSPSGRKMYVDGFSPGDGRQLKPKAIITQPVKGDVVLEYFGCFFHFCKQCYPLGRDRVVCTKTKRTMDEIYQETMDRISLLEEMGFKVETIWEHEFKQMMSDDPATRNFINSIAQFQEPLVPRSAFVGGRTEVFRMSYNEEDYCVEKGLDLCVMTDTHGENPSIFPRVEYVDVTSLYPFVMKNREFPLGHPTVLTKDFNNHGGFDYTLNSYFGLVKAKVLPPKGLYFPILPAKCKGKLVFTLCRTCAENEAQVRSCRCPDSRRWLMGCWTTPELKLALAKGYKILEIYEIYHYDNTTKNTIDPFTGENVNLFRDYVNLFLKAKTENSGFPPGCISHEDKLRYQQEYLEVEGIELDIDAIEFNPSKRQIAKLFLCAAYGKLAQKSGKSQTSIINGNNPSKLFSILGDPRLVVSDFNIFSDDTLMLDYSNREGSIHAGNADNVILAAFVSSYGRIDLDSYADSCGERVLYCDTDSVIFVAESPEQLLPLGPFLGQLTSELPQGERITNFLATGPKSYGYILSNGESVIKYKGFTLNLAASRVMNIEAMRNLLYNYASKLSEQIAGCESHMEHFDLQVSVTSSTMFRLKRTMSINGRLVNKKYTIAADKRMFFEDLTSLPFGY